MSLGKRADFGLGSLGMGGGMEDLKIRGGIAIA